jgi:hypothetical protein
MFSDAHDSLSVGALFEVWLDGLPVNLPPERRSLGAIRCYLERLALEQQRILYSFRVNGRCPNFGRPLATLGPIQVVEAETIALEQTPLHLVNAAREQVAQARARLESAVVLVLINEGTVASELWWKLAQELKAPLLTLSLLPETICGPANGRASLSQLRKWQLQQLAAIIKEVDEACGSGSSRTLSNVLENRALPWLIQLQDSLELWRETLLADSSATGQRAALAERDA